MKTILQSLLLATALVLQVKADAVEVVIEKSIALAWQSEIGKSYRIEASEDMQNWIVAVPSVTGSGQDMTRHFPVTSKHQFYRVVENEKPAWFVGRWIGQTLETGSAPYQTTIQLDPATGTYTSTYPMCAGRLNLISVTDTEIVFEEIITENPQNCPFVGRIVLRKLGDDRITFSWSHPDLAGGAFGHFERN